MQAQGVNWAQWVVLVCSILLLLGGLFVLPGSLEKRVIKNLPDAPKIPSVPSADEIADEVVERITLPTSEEIADLVDVPEPSDTAFSVKEEKEELAEQLALDELEDEDFKEWLVDELLETDEIEDIDEDDITKIDIRDLEVTHLALFPNDETAIVEIKAKVYFNNYGDDDENEVVRVYFEFEVEDLDFDEDYEDAEVTDYGNYELLKCYNDLC